MPSASIHLRSQCPYACSSFFIVMGSYYATYINKNSAASLNLLIEQGHEIARDGRVQVTETKKNGQHVIEVTGSAVYVNEFEVSI
jgi:predicted PhzF superfamily epimerase YddE/YHI9